MPDRAGAVDHVGDPAGEQAGREEAIKKWRKLIPPGKLPPKPEPPKPDK